SRPNPIEAPPIAAVPPRACLELPRTHALVVSVLELLGVTVARVEVTELKDGTFYALLLLDRSGVTFEVDARPSDALAVAVRVGAPIFVAPHVLEESGLRDAFDVSGGAEA